MTKNNSTTRKNNTYFSVYCLPEERERIMKNAKAADMPVSRFLRTVGQAHVMKAVKEVKVAHDLKGIEELSKINGDLGRLGGLLKLWLTNDEKLRRVHMPDIETLLGEIIDAKALLTDRIYEVLGMHKRI